MPLPQGLPQASDPEYWFVGNVCLNTYAWGVTTLGAGRTLPIMRGNNIQVAYIPGQVYRKKYPDSRVITLSMWTAGIDPNTGQPSTDDQHIQWSNNYRKLQNVFYNVGGSQFPLTRQWIYTLPVSTGTPYGVNTLVQATAMAEIAGDMAPTMQGPTSSAFTVDLLLADPYFYGPPINASIPFNTPTEVVNTGDDVAAYHNNTITMYGPLTFPRLTNSSTLPTATWIQLNTFIAEGDAVVFDIANFTAYRASDGANLSGSVAHSGMKRWMSYSPGTSSMLLTSSNSNDTGYVDISFTPPYA